MTRHPMYAKRPTRYCDRCESMVYSDDVHSCFDAKAVRAQQEAERALTVAERAVIVLHAVAWFLFTQLEFDPQQHDPRATTIPGERRVYYERLAHALMTTAQRARQAVPA